MQVPMYAAVPALFHAIGMKRHMGKHEIIDNPCPEEFVKVLGVVLRFEDVVVAQDETFMAFESMTLPEMLFPDRHVAQVINVIRILHCRVPAVDNRLVHFLDRGELAEARIVRTPEADVAKHLFVRKVRVGD